MITYCWFLTNQFAGFPALTHCYLLLLHVLHCFLTGDADPSRVALRPRESPHPMVSVEEAVETVLKETGILATEEVYFKSKWRL